MAADDEPSRLESEIELVLAMYPEQASYDSKAREFKFVQDNAQIQLRLPDSYPESSLPDVIAATDASKNDLRAEAKQAIRELNLPAGEEVIDAIISAFQGLVASREVMLHTSPENNGATTSDAEKKTVIIWLHHLLATGKRKLAISPQASVSGITKPGYPGVMIFTGSLEAVGEHVNELKNQNWQAFQVRYEEMNEWRFGHGGGVTEVESMGEVVKLLEEVGKGPEDVAAGKQQKQTFLKAVGIK